MDLEKKMVVEFPSLIQGRACIAQKEYEIAVNIFTEILSQARFRYDEKSHEMCFLYLDYSAALIALCYATNFDKLQKLASKEQVNLFEFDNDLEIAWEVLEICRVFYTENNDLKNLEKTHFLLGEVLINDNKFIEALEEYSLAEQNSETLYRKALCHEFLEQWEVALNILIQIPLDNEELVPLIKEEIEFIRSKHELQQESKVELTREIGSFNEDEVQNVSNLIKKKD